MTVIAMGPQQALKLGYLDRLGPGRGGFRCELPNPDRSQVRCFPEVPPKLLMPFGMAEAEADRAEIEAELEWKWTVLPCSHRRENSGSAGGGWGPHT